MAETRHYSMRSKSEDLTQEKDNAIAEWISFIAGWTDPEEPGKLVLWPTKIAKA